MKVRFGLLVAIIICVFAVGFSVDYNASAQSTEPPKGLTLSPLRTEISTAPGTSFSDQLKVTNSTEKQMTVSFMVEEFKVIDEQYDYEFIAESNITSWVSFKPSEVVLKAGEAKKVNYTVGIPLTAEPGGYYISMFASSAVAAGDGDGNSQQRVASLLYITAASDVLGAATRSGHVLSLSSPWLVVDKGAWGMTLQNAGTTHYRSEYTVKTEDLFGGTVGENKDSALILPGTIRAIQGEMSLPSVPGIYRVIYTIGLGDVPGVTETHYMVFLPPWAILTLTTAIVVAGYLSYRKLSKKH
jgi:hypothetical protein